MLKGVRNERADVVADFTPEASQVMDPKAAFLTQSLLEGVMNFGYGYAVRQKGFTAPAAGKTGTSHDAWFAAYTSNLICIVWVGNDDYTDVKLQGAVAAAPIWAEFMNRAIKLPQYSDMRPFTPPGGVTNYRIDKVTNQLADESCPGAYTAAFLDGSQPQSTCSHMGGGQPGVLGDVLGYGPNATQIPALPLATEGIPERTPEREEGTGQPKRKNFLQKLFGGGAKKTDEPPQDQPAPQ